MSLLTKFGITHTLSDRDYSNYSNYAGVPPKKSYAENYASIFPSNCIFGDGLLDSDIVMAFLKQKEKEEKLEKFDNLRSYDR